MAKAKSLDSELQRIAEANPQRTPHELQGEDLEEWLKVVRWWRERGGRTGVSTQGQEELFALLEERFRFRTARTASGQLPNRETYVRWLSHKCWDKML